VAASPRRRRRVSRRFRSRAGVLEYRAQQKKKEACEEKLRRAKEQEPEGDDEFAGRSQQDLSRRLSRITQELERVAAEKGEHEGQRKQAREVAREHANDLATARYKGVEERHRRAMIDKETTEMVSDSASFPNVSELQAASTASSRCLDALFMIIRESTRLAREPRPCRDAVVRHRPARTWSTTGPPSTRPWGPSTG
jgi:hypothetical protein